MNCKDTIHLICSYLEGKLSAPVTAEIDRHIDHCANCKAILEAATTTLDRYFGADFAGAPHSSTQIA
jgi:anti-sigma factor RsiW